MGLAAVLLLPREEEPQIKVPMIDVMVTMPGFSAKEVEERATRPMEKLLWEIPGVEYIYSTSRPGESLVIVRFKVGEDRSAAWSSSTRNCIRTSIRIPHGVSSPLIKPRSIDDVPILALTFHSAHYDHLTLRRLVAQVDDAVKQVPLVAETSLIGGARRQVRVLLDPVRAGFAQPQRGEICVPMLDAGQPAIRCRRTHQQQPEISIETGGFLEKRAKTSETWWWACFGGRPVYLREVAEIVDGAEEPSQYVFFGSGRGHVRGGGRTAGGHAEHREAPRGERDFRGGPGAQEGRDAQGYASSRSDVEMSVTRITARPRRRSPTNCCCIWGSRCMGVSVLILLTLGWRESGIVAIAIPATLALTLLVFYLYGYTLNRITLFALIFSIGILVDDAIVVVENIVRHFHLPQNRGRGWSDIAVEAVNEVGNPTILATFAVIAAVLPMAFVGGLMGPYMRPIPIGSERGDVLLAGDRVHGHAVGFDSDSAWGENISLTQSGTCGRQARTRTSEDLLHADLPAVHGAADRAAGLALGFSGRHRRLCLLGAMALVGIGWVKLKMLPFDNKSEFQIILNMPEGSCARTDRPGRARDRRRGASRTRGDRLPDYAGVAAPFNFNGLVRHYFMRRGANVADLQMNLTGKGERKAQSHEIAKRVRPRVAAIVERYGARVAVAEVPPGPPVLQTLVAEIYGPTEEATTRPGRRVRDMFKKTPGCGGRGLVRGGGSAQGALCRLIRKRRRCTGSAPRTISRRCGWRSAANPWICCTHRGKRRT